MTLIPVKGTDGNTYNLEYVTGPGGGQVPAVPVEGDQIGQGGGTSTSSSQQLAAANSSRRKIDISNSGDTGVWLTFHASNAAVAGQGRFLPRKSQGTYYSSSRVAFINESGGGACAVGYSEFAG